jgi:hypothetical protein
VRVAGAVDFCHLAAPAIAISTGSIPLFWIAFITPSDARAPIVVEIQYVSVAAH